MIMKNVKIKSGIIQGMLLILMAMIAGSACDRQPAAPETLTAVIHADQKGEPIHPYMYGMFTELLGNYFEKGTWAEMITDRKFFFPVRNDTMPRRIRGGFNPWRTVGPQEIITMDREEPYVGEQNVNVHLAPSDWYGIQQSGIGLGMDRAYTGRIILSGDPDTRVAVSLIWGEDPGDSETVTIPALTDEFRKYPLGFTSGATTDSGRIEITGTGTGAFQIGAVSLMPADNVEGFRPDLISLLKDMNSAIYRWPGGNILAGYDWREGIGDPDRRPPRYDYSRIPILEDNDVGTDDFMTMCDLLDIEPYMVVNIGFGDAFSAAQWVGYCNGSVDTPMGKWRAENGHPEPYNVRIWGIGNEMYGQWQLGHMSINHFIMKHIMFADAMRAVDPDIEIVACGATLYEINTTNRHHRLFPDDHELPFQYDTPEDWSGNLLERASDYFEHIAEHAYPYNGHAFDKGRQEWVEVHDSLPERVRQAANRVKGAAEAMHEYHRRIPGLKEENIKYFFDEWRGTRRGFEGPLSTAMGMHELFRHTDVYLMSGYTGYIRNLVWNANEAWYSGIGVFFKLYRDRFGTIPLEITGNSPQKRMQGTVLVDIPEIPSGSPTYPLDLSAAFSEDGSKLTLGIINPTFEDQEINVSFEGVSPGDGYNVCLIRAPEISADNTPGEEPGIFVAESRVNSSPGTFRVPPLSITMFEMDVN